MKIDVSKLSKKPWLDLEQDVAAELMLPKGFILEEERRCLHYIARHCVSGGQIVDAGAALGASAYCLASGLSRGFAQGQTKVHSYDRFTSEAEYVSELVTKHFRPSKVGDDIFDIFQYQTGRYNQSIVPHHGDFMTERWDGSPIDILFVDLAKTAELNVRIAEQFYPHLKPQASLLIHQDFYFPWLPYIHVSMQYLAHRFEIVDHLIPDCSRLFLLKDAISAEEIAHLGAISREERLDLLDAFIDGERGNSKAMARVNKLTQRYLDEDEKGYQNDRDKLMVEFNGIDNSTKWGQMFADLEAIASERWGSTT